MSLETWKAEFYPVRVKSGTGEINVPANEAVAHSIKKWQGLTEKNLEKHGLISDPDASGIMEEADKREFFPVDLTTCALCAHYLGSRTDPTGDERLECVTCPLSIARGVSCDERDLEDDESPYDAWVDFGEAQPMLDALAAAAEYEAEQAKEQADADQDKPGDS